MKTFPLFSLVALILASAASSSAQLLVAHRGASGNAPENTVAAFRKAWDEGADAIEGDFYLTSDGEIVCIHDKDTKRICPGGPVRVVSETTCADLCKLDVGSWKHADFTGERIPTLDEVLDVVPDGKRIFIEIKCGPEIVPVLKQKLAARKSPPPAQLVIICFDAGVIAACRRELPEIAAYWLVGFKKDKQEGTWSPTLDTIMDTLKQSGASGLDVQSETAVIDKSFAERLREEGFAFHCWTINDADHAKVFQDLGVDSITTDQPALLRRELGLDVK
jgi:glycerophosphoryl diester phosphodiesterase